MKAAVLYKPNTSFVIEELDLDEPGPGQVLVKTMATGVCHSDWHVVKGDWQRIPLPSILGHEAAGVVEGGGARCDQGRARRPRRPDLEARLRPV